MEVVYRCCCGIDVHKKVIVACLVNGGEQELREFGTTTSEIKTLANWLTESGCEMIAMESTGVFWKPLYNLFELMDLDAMIVNAAHMKALPGRKTDVKDAEWIADLLRRGLLKASYIPNREQRELREITRYRKSLTEERCREINRLQKILEGANIKLDSVVKDITGKSARKLLQRIIDDDIPDSDEVSKLVHGRMRPKLEQIVASIEGITTPLQRKLLAQIIDHISSLGSVPCLQSGFTTFALLATSALMYNAFSRSSGMSSSSFVSSVFSISRSLLLIAPKRKSILLREAFRQTHEWKIRVYQFLVLIFLYLYIRFFLELKYFL